MPAQYGPHEGDASVADFIDATVAVVYRGNSAELALLAKLGEAYAAIRVLDVTDLELATKSMHDDAIGRVYGPAEIRGVMNQVLKYLGPRGHPHVPPRDAEEPAGARLLAIAMRAWPADRLPRLRQ